MCFRVFVACLLLSCLRITAQSLPATIKGEQFAADPELHATLRQVAVFDLSPPDPGALKGTEDPVARYRLGSGKHTFCLDENDPYLYRGNDGRDVSRQAGRSIKPFESLSEGHARWRKLPHAAAP